MKKGRDTNTIGTKNNKSDRLGIILFFCILVSLIPILISSIINPGFINGRLYPITVGIMFLIQVFLLLFYYPPNIKWSINKRLFLFAWAFMIIQTITLLISSLKGIQIDNLDFINIIIRFILLLIFFCIPSRFYITKKGLQTFMLLIVILGFVGCIYNIFQNFNGMINILNINNPNVINFQSFYLNRNHFGQLLFFALIANTFLFLSKRSVFNWLCYFLFGINIITTLSRTVIASVIIFELIFFIIYFKRKKAIVTLLTLLLPVLFINSNQAISNFINNMLIREDAGISGRTILWQIGLEILNKSNWAFGIGYNTSEAALRNSGSRFHEFHNFYIETLVGCGIVGLLFHLIIIGLVLKKVKNIYRNDKETGAVFFSGYIALMFFAFFESISFFTLGYVGSIFTIFFITIPILYSNSFNKQNMNEKVVAETVSN